jgi:tetratricopeptide (TPR) repeat protein
MIVKNEGKVIERLLDSVAPYIDTYCICDTGSTDDTIDKIQSFFNKRSIEGIICSEPFQDFGYNRSVSLTRCLKMNDVDYILFLDADMVFYVNPVVSATALKQHLHKADAFYILQGTRDLHYQNVRIVKKTPNLHYWGVTHEHLVLPKGVSPIPLIKEQVFIQDIGDGGSKNDKYPRDIKLLQKGLIQHPGNSRYLFYLANSYKNNNQLTEAIETYLKRIEAGDWIEEVWYSYYNIGHCYYELNDISKALYYWMEGYQVYPCRIENLYHIVHHYRIHEKYELAYSFYLTAKRMLEKNTEHNHLFMENDIYVYKLDYEYSVIAFYCNCNKIDAAKTSMSLLEYPHLSESLAANVLSNYKFYVNSLIKSSNNNHHELLACFSSCVLAMDGFHPSSPSICKIDDANYLLNIRYVNYVINDQGKYICNEHITTRNVLCHITHNETWEIKSRKELGYDTSHDDYYQGLEDVRLFSSSSSGILYTCNRGIAARKIQIETGSIDLISSEVQNSRLLHYSKSKSDIEKNWVFAPSSNSDNLPIVYSWHPLVLGNVKNNELVETHRIDTPIFFRHLRGSCHGIRIENELWFLCHAVSDENRRYYYHCFVVLDASTYAYKKHTTMFTFEKEPIEYCIGINYEPNGDFIMGYSILDGTTQFISIAKSTFL